MRDMIRNTFCLGKRINGSPMALRYLTYFVVYSFLGWAIDTAFRSAMLGHYASGTLIPFFGIIYGCAALCILAAGQQMHKRSLLLQAIVYGSIATAVEYIGGNIGLALTGRMLWDYSGYPYDYHGFIAPYTSLAWALLSLLLVLVIHPRVQAHYNRYALKTSA